MADPCYYWRYRPGAPPSPRYGSEIVYDSARGVAVLYGGRLYAGGVYTTETWEWDGVQWHLASRTGPAARGHRMVYDSVRGVVVLFLGYTTGETYEWDGSTWTLRATTGPTPRQGYAMTYDSVRGVTVLHGGVFFSPRTVFNDTWEWDGNTWTLRSTNGPDRRDHSMAYNSISGLTMLYGGRNQDGSMVIRETWYWDGESWAFIEADTGPYADSNRAMIFDASRNVMTIFDIDYEYPPSDVVWEWDGTTWTSTPTLGPSEGIGNAITFDTNSGFQLYFGDNDLWTYDDAEWNLIWGGGPRYPEVSFDTWRNVALGVNSCCRIQETWALNGTSWSLLTREGPPLRRDFSLTFDEARGVAVLFGGYIEGGDTDTYLNDTWEWDGTTWEQKLVAAPAPRAGHRMVYDSVRGVSVLFGGADRPTYWDFEDFGDTWEWDGAEWTERIVPGPSVRHDHGMAFDRTRGVAVLFGGTIHQPPYNEARYGDTWEYDGSTWTQRIVSGPQPRYWHEMVYDQNRGVTVLAGGGYAAHSGGAYYYDTWEWDGVQWISRIATGSASSLLVYDSTLGLVRYCSEYGVWEYPGYLSRPVPPQPQLVNSCGGCTAISNRYLSFSPPLAGNTGLALRVTATQMPGAEDCPNVPDFSDRFVSAMWVGDELIVGGQPTGVYQLTDTPAFRSWVDLPGEVIHVSDCNIVPCASYSVEAVEDTPCDSGVPSVFSLPLALSTSPVWGDIVGSDVAQVPNGIVDFIDISAGVDRFRNIPSAPPGTWCDLGGNNPAQGVVFNIDFTDISLVVDAFRGRSYPFPGPSAPNVCP